MVVATCHGGVLVQAWELGPNDAELHEFITSDILRAILEATLVMFRLIQEGIIELMEGRLGILCKDGC